MELLLDDPYVPGDQQIFPVSLLMLLCIGMPVGRGGAGGLGIDIWSWHFHYFELV